MNDYQDGRDIDEGCLAIQEGRWYRDRRRVIHGPLAKNDNRHYPWRDPDGNCWSKEGRWACFGDEDSHIDLITEVEWVPPESTSPPKTLRDEFAMAALTGLLANSEGVHAGMEPVSFGLKGQWAGRTAETLAKHSYAIADAMEAERAKRLRARTDSTNGEG